MKKLRKTDYIILAVLLVLVICIGCVIVHGNQSDANRDAAESEKSASEISFTDFDGKRFGIKTGSGFEPVTLQKFPNSEYFYFDSVSDEIAALQADKIDAFLEDEPVARMIHVENSSIDYIREPLVDDDYHFAFNKSDRATKLMGEFNEYLAAIQADGTSDALLEKWFSSDDAAKTIDKTGLTGKNGTVTVAVIPDIIPFTYIANNELQGYAVEIMIGFGRKYGYDIQFEQANITACLAGIAAEKYDVLAGCVSVTEERKETMNFSDVVYNGGFMLMARASDLSHTGQSESELTYTAYNGKKIGILTGTNMEAESFKYFPDSEYFYYDGYPNLNTALLNGTIDAYLGDEPALKSIHAEQPKIDYIKKRLTNNQYSFAFRKDEESERKLCDQLNAFLQKSNADGTIAEMDDIWFGVDDSRKVVDMSDLTGENGTIHIVTTSTDEPFSYIKDGKHIGYDIDAVVRFCREYGYALEIGDVDFQARIPALASGKYEFTTSMNVTPEREEEVMFSDPVSSGGIVVAVRAEDLGKNVDSANVESRPLSYYAENGKFGAITGGLYEVKLQERFPDAEILQFNNQPDMAVALSSGIIDAFTCPRSTAEDFMKSDPTLTCLNEVFMEIHYGFAFQKSADQEILRDRMNEFLQKLHADGTYDEIVAVWFGDDESVKHVDFSGLTGKNGTLRYITASTMQPFSYIENGKNAGIEVDIITRFCTEYGYGLKIDNAEFASLIPGITSGTYDIASGTIMITPERAESVNFSDVYYTADAVAVVRRESDTGNLRHRITSVQQLNDTQYTVGASNGASGMFAVEKLLPNARLALYDSQVTGYESVRQGKIDAYVFDRTQMEIAIRNGFSGVKLLDENLGDDIYIAVGISRKSEFPDLKKELDAFITKYKADGTIDDALSRWVYEQNYNMPDISEPDAPARKLVIGTTGIVEPYSFYIGDQLSGFDLELIRRFAKEVNAEVEIRTYDYTGIIAAAESGEIDCIFANLNITKERMEVIDFSEPIYSISNAVMVASDDASPVADDQSSWFDRIRMSFEKNFIRENRWKLIVQGIITTCIITVLTVLFGSVLAFLICLFRRTDSILAGKIADIYVKILQGTPMVVLLMILYYVIFGKSGMPAIWVAVIGFSLNFAAYTSETLRSGIDSIDRGQREAALALGYSEHQAFFRFIFPQAAVRQLPVYRGEIISLLKNTSIVGYIAIQDLTKMSEIIRSRTYEAFFPLIVTAIIYFILAWVISLILKMVLKQIDPRLKKRNVKGGAEK